MKKIFNLCAVIFACSFLANCSTISKATVAVATLPIKVASAVATETVKAGGRVIKQVASSTGDITKEAVSSGSDVAGQMVKTVAIEGTKVVKEKAGTVIDSSLGLPDGTGKAAMTVIDLVK